VFYPAAGTVEPGDVFDDKKKNNNRFHIPEKPPGGFGNVVGIDDKKDAHQDVEEDDKEIDQFPGDCFAVDEVKLDCFPKGHFCVLVFFHLSTC
jgi:hypothetical protein